jgi:hypothetical protein
MLPVALNAQAPTAPSKAGDSASRWDIFAGYSYLDPKGTVTGTTSAGVSHSVDVKSEKVGFVLDLARFFNKNIGWQVDAGFHDRVYDDRSSDDSNTGLITVQTGPIYRWPGVLTPWVHALVGGASFEGPYHQGYSAGVTYTLGGGADVKLGHHFSWRIVEADYEYLHVDHGDAHFQSGNDEPYQEGGRANLNGLRLASGIVYSIGTIAPPPPVTLSCAVSPDAVYPGEPVTVTATAGNLNPKLHAIYSWNGAGASGNGTTANVATASLDPGTYTVKGEVKEGKPGKEGLKPGRTADCSATFTVKAFEPPTISCSANPGTIKPGESATVTATAVSPQNRPLTISYSATAGTIAGSGNTATYTSTGAPTGAVGITCTANDDKGHSASANTGVTIVAPPAPPAPHTSAQCSITFDKDKKRPTRVDNEAKACLDEVALSLQRQSDSKAVVVGDANAKEKAATAKQEKKAAKNKHVKVLDSAAERAVNAKAYLVTDKGIDAARVSVATGTEDSKKVENYLVPAGANFTADVNGTTPVDETKVKTKVRKPLAEHHHAAKKAEK